MCMTSQWKKAWSIDYSISLHWMHSGETTCPTAKDFFTNSELSSSGWREFSARRQTCATISCTLHRTNNQPSSTLPKFLCWIHTGLTGEKLLKVIMKFPACSFVKVLPFDNMPCVTYQSKHAQPACRVCKCKWTSHIQRLTYYPRNTPQMAIKVCWEEVESPQQYTHIVTCNKVYLLNITDIHTEVLEITSELSLFQLHLSAIQTSDIGTLPEQCFNCLQFFSNMANGIDILMACFDFSRTAHICCVSGPTHTTNSLCPQCFSFQGLLSGNYSGPLDIGTVNSFCPVVLGPHDKCLSLSDASFLVLWVAPLLKSQLSHCLCWWLLWH